MEEGHSSGPIRSQVGISFDAHKETYIDVQFELLEGEKAPVGPASCALTAFGHLLA